MNDSRMNGKEESMHDLLVRLMDKLAGDGMIFSNEQDFQFELALLLKAEPKVLKVKLEAMSLNSEWKEDKKYVKQDKEYTDILIETVDKKWYAIELKNKNADHSYMYESKECGNVLLINQGAKNDNSEAFWEDVSRLEKINQRFFPNGIKIEKGYAIFLTNYRDYRANAFGGISQLFSMNDGRVVPPEAIRKEAQEQNLNCPQIKHTYTLKWHDYNVGEYRYSEKATENEIPGFSYLLVDVDPV